MYGNFYGVIARAANSASYGGCDCEYSPDMLRADFPQFFGTSDIVPSNILDMFCHMASKSISHERWNDDWRYAAGLYVAHLTTLYLRSYKESSTSPSDAAESGAVIGNVSSASLGDGSVSYDNSSVNAAIQKWGALSMTSYGQQLASMARLVGMGGMYVI